MPRDAASQALRCAVLRFIDEAEAFAALKGATPETVEDDPSPERDETPPPRFAIVAEASLGKTEEVIRAVAPLVGRGRRVLYLGPSIALAAELEERARARGIEATQVIRGRSQPNPETGAPMCEKADIAAIVSSLGYGVKTTLCEDKAGNRCEFADRCAYLGQMQNRAKGGALLIGAHAYLPIAMELLNEKRIDLVIIDESFWQSLVRHTTVPLHRFQTEREPNAAHRTYRRRKEETPEQAAERFQHDRAEFAKVHGKARRALATAHAEKRQPTLNDFRAEHLSPGDCRFAAGVEFSRIGVAEIHPGMGAAFQRELLERAVTREAYSLGRFWKLVGAELETKRVGLLQSTRIVVDHLNRAGDLETAIVMDYSAEARFQKTPVLMIDADADAVILDRFYPGVRTETIAAEWTGVRIRQVSDRTGSKASLASDGNRNRVRLVAEDVARQLRPRIEALRDRHRDSPATPDFRPIVIVQKSLEDRWREEGRPFAFDGEADAPDAPFHVAHFANTRGKDGWKNAAAAIVVGRIEPSPQALETMARAVFYRSEQELVAIVPDAEGRIRLPHREIAMSDRQGKRVVVCSSFHPDDRADRLLRQIREGELSQAIARVRPVHRDRANPCEVLVLTNVPLRVMPDEFTTWKEVIPDRWREMEMAGFVPDLLSDVSDAYPDLFATPAAARQAASRARKCDAAYKDSFYGGCHTYEGMIRVEYRREGNRRGRQAWVIAVAGDTPETVAQRVRERLPDAFAIVPLGPLPDPLDAAVAASDAADDLALYVEEAEEAGEVVWWRDPSATVPARRPWNAARPAPRPRRDPDPGRILAH